MRGWKADASGGGGAVNAGGSGGARGCRRLRRSSSGLESLAAWGLLFFFPFLRAASREAG
jgi:hypothetical protein